ncbi:Eco57I restriction-modification methylase domain-containing protein [Seonamhaeicola sp. ML3]|uniref:type IIG restriction enzyme/methyltransferase n=1 Tax=Seonamhaeicola sp. ML3 TaxID=2937786 RepID=UPI00200E94A2|nr:TaqI-like C-terminal specificity domain-containing protein [Seonamhaeicola sp. ML3]
MNKTNTRKALNPAYRKHKPLRKDVTHFTSQLVECIEAVKLSDDNGESEEHIKSHFKDFFSNTFYKANYVNTKDRIDLAIYTDATANSDVGVIIEAKKPSNKSEFLTESNLNRKALQELLLYYLRERLDNENNNIKHLIATNGYEWYLFKAEDFYNYFYKNKALLKEYKAFRDGLKDTSKNELFYNEIAKKYIAEIEQELPFVHLDFTKTNFTKLSDAHLNTLFKIFSDVHLLGHAFGNDSNQLNKAFYNELLHIIGLEEVKVKGKKLISRKSEKSRDYASLLENTIVILEDRDYLSQIKSIENGEDKAFNAGLELCLTWVNRILFLKLLESQLLSYHNKDPKYRFLNASFITDYDELNDLFFSALAKKENERHPKYKEKYKDVPYLNSSLFERNTLENEAFEISALNNDEITLYSSTVLKDANGKRLKGKLSTLDYLFQFLEAYDFATDGKEGIEDAQETKSLINASVLGLIFEKINGYKEGSFYTPAYITMYMCKETLRRAVVQKFKEQENDQIETFEDLQSYCNKYFKIDDLKRFNTIVDSLRICDPAVGSGHFLVSALNELIVIKNELGILVDAKGLPLRCDIEIVNDELYVIDDKGALFEYTPNDRENIRIQHTLFHQKQTLIENCLFGVDINPNSVKICRLRLWIELLKNAYYTKDNALHTLPNIDINIKCGNSLISRFNLDDDLKDAFKGKDVNYSFKDYKNAVAEYKETNSKERKREVLEIINEVKHNFKSTLDNAFIIKFQKAQGQLINEQERQKNLKAFGEKITKKDKDELKKLKTKAEKALIEKEEIVNNAIYHNAFEWRFEFPEVLADDGSYIGFDAVIGNPPYLIEYDKKVKNNLEINFIEFKRNNDLYVAFISRGNKILNDKGFLSYITPNTFLKGTYFQKLRELLISNKIIEIINFNNTLVFDEANVYTSILLFQKGAIPTNWVLKKGISEIEGEIDKNELDFIYKSPLIKKLDVFEKFENFFLIKDVGFNYWSIGRGKTRGDSVGSRILYSGKQLNDSDKPYLKGGDIFRYSQKTPSNYLRHNFEELLNENDVFRFSKDFFELNPKIIYRQTSKDIIATIDTNCNYNDKTVHIVVNNEESNFDLHFVLGLLNSSLLNFYLHFYKQESGKAFAQIKTVDIKAMPFIYKESSSVSIKQKVKQVLSFKKENPEADTTVLEAEIDAMVYELYGLTPDEIKIVEQS